FLAGEFSRLPAKAQRLLSRSVESVPNDAAEPHERLDVGFSRLRKAIRAIQPIGPIKNPDPTWKELTRLYSEQLAAPLFSVRQAPVLRGHTMTPPRIVQAFIPQSYRAVGHDPGERHYGDDLFWARFPKCEDLGRFLLTWLMSERSMGLPLVILGPTGAGKTLLTRVLAAHLCSTSFHPVRVVLGSVDARDTIQGQIEDQLRADTGRKVEWGALSRSVREQYPLVLLDGMNDLLGANERIFRDYPEKARRFQELEASLGRPVRLILTSRTEVIDRADIPAGAVVVRLEPFDEPHRSHWIRLWNRANRGYFRATGVQPLTAPENPAVQQLSETPFMLALLAVLDADGNPLRSCGALSRAALYQQIIQRFVARSLPPGAPTELIHQEFQRLGAAAMGMFHRRSLSIRSDDLERDAPFLLPPAGDGTTLTTGNPYPPSGHILDRLFFVNVQIRDHRNKSASLGREKESPRTYAFWHAAFGEFLAADFIIRLTWEEAARICRERRGRNRAQRKLSEERFRDPLTTPELWLSTLIHTPLFDRPGVLSILRERVRCCFMPEKGERNTPLNQENFLIIADEMVQGQLHWILQGNTLPPLMTGDPGPVFVRLPALGHLAVYSLNLVILRSVLDTEAWTLDEASHASREDGVPAWDRLTHLWRSWFTAEHLSRLRGILHTSRQDGRMRIQARPLFSCVRSVRGLSAYRELARVLADEDVEMLADLALGSISREDSPRQ
ncbi:MAG: ATP-binding protein, partial [Magnetococcales bacterium]|nr:ATP-binding protein [Magnetococcales bacterium]